MCKASTEALETFVTYSRSVNNTLFNILFLKTFAIIG